MGLVESWNNYHRRVGEVIGGAAAITAENNVIMGAIVPALCGLASKYPSTWAAPPYTRGWVNSACNDAGLPGFPAPADLPRGGQCDTIYVVEYTAISNFGNFDRVSQIRGPILDIYAVQGGNILADVLRGEPPSRLTIVFDGAGPYTDVDIKSIERLDGLPDDCGNSPDYYPPDPAIDFNDFTITINHTDGSVQNYTTSTNISNSTSISFNGGGTTIKIGNDGVSISDGDDSAVKDDPPSSDTTTTFIPEDDPEKFDINKYPAPGDEEEGLDELEVENDMVDWVLVEIAVPPVKGKTILQNNPEDNDYFAGYFSWIINVGSAYRLEQQAIRKRLTAFRAPENISGYRIYAVNGAKLAITEYTQIIEEGAA